jgi:hypothetical protein
MQGCSTGGESSAFGLPHAASVVKPKTRERPVRMFVDVGTKASAKQVG